MSAELLNEPLTHRVHEVFSAGAVVVDEAAVRRFQARLHIPTGPVVDHLKGQVLHRHRLLRGDVTLDQHPLQHRVPAKLCLLRIEIDICRLRRADQARQVHGLGQALGAQLRRVIFNPDELDALAEIGVGGGLYAVRPTTEVNGVEVVGEDLLFGASPFQLDRQHRFPNLAAETAFLGEEGVLHVLLGDCGATLELAAALHVADQGPSYAERIDPTVTEVVAVLCRQNCLDHDRRNLLVADQLPVDPSLKTGHLVTVGATAGYLGRAQVGGLGQLGGVGQCDPRHDGGHPGHAHHE